MSGTLPAGGGSSMRPGTQVKKIQKGKTGGGSKPTAEQTVPPAKLPVTGK